MLNGKFFTGLPPKMIDKNSTARNRQESHFFWPDDSRAESAVDARIKRRNSMQGNDRAAVYEKQTSVEPNDVDTKERFSKEFSKSSIQFYDNLNDNMATGRRRSQLQSREMKKRIIAEKPTATKLELPESVVDEAYTTAKKKQAYTSTIEFNDFVNEEDNSARRNNLRKPKMDMNDKREMELNSKNSPKLQMKRDVRSISAEKELPKLNNRDVRTLGRSTNRIKHDIVKPIEEREVNIEQEEYEKSNAIPKRNLINNKKSESAKSATFSSPERQKHRIENNKSSKQTFENPKRNFIEPEERYLNEREMFRNYNKPVLNRNGGREYCEEPIVYKNLRYSSHISNERQDDFYENPKYSKSYNNRISYDYPESRRTLNDYEEEIDKRMKNVRIQQSPPRRYHQQQILPEDEQHYDHVEDFPRSSRNRSVFPDKSNRINVQRHLDYNDNERYERNIPYVEEEEVVRPINRNRTNLKRVNNKLNNESHTGWGDNDNSELIVTKSQPTTSPSQSAASISSSARMHNSNNTSHTDNNNSIKKHLRSSLCFHDGAIIAENDATTRSPTTATSIAKRNARSSATQRVSVGLPD